MTQGSLSKHLSSGRGKRDAGARAGVSAVDQRVVEEKVGVEEFAKRPAGEVRHLQLRRIFSHRKTTRGRLSHRAFGSLTMWFAALVVRHDGLDLSRSHDGSQRRDVHVSSHTHTGRHRPPCPSEHSRDRAPERAAFRETFSPLGDHGWAGSITTKLIDTSRGPEL